jgi:hypothetical protein
MIFTRAFALFLLAAAPVAAQGKLAVMKGSDASGAPICYVREEGSSHRLDIGIAQNRSTGAATNEAFVRLETPEQRDGPPPSSPVWVFAGQRQKNDYTPLVTFMGEVEYIVPQRDRANFTLVAKGDLRTFLGVIASARDRFLVVRARALPTAVDYVAIYQFDTAAADALVACAGTLKP